MIPLWLACICTMLTELACLPEQLDAPNSVPTTPSKTNAIIQRGFISESGMNSAP